MDIECSKFNSDGFIRLNTVENICQNTHKKNNVTIILLLFNKEISINIDTITQIRYFKNKTNPHIDNIILNIMLFFIVEIKSKKLNTILNITTVINIINSIHKFTIS